MKKELLIVCTLSSLTFGCSEASKTAAFEGKFACGDDTKEITMFISKDSWDMQIQTVSFSEDAREEAKNEGHELDFVHSILDKDPSSMLLTVKKRSTDGNVESRPYFLVTKKESELAVYRTRPSGEAKGSPTSCKPAN